MPIYWSDDTEHGTRASYARGCRCDACKATEKAYQAQRAQARGNGEPGWIDAGPAQAHIAKLRTVHIGLHQIAQLSGVSFSTVQAIADGKPRIQVRTATAILNTQPIPAMAAT